MDGAGSRYITPYALAIGANNTQIGLLTSIPSLLGNLSQLFTSKIIEKTSRKKNYCNRCFTSGADVAAYVGCRIFIFL